MEDEIEALESQYGGGLDPEIQDMYEYAVEYGPLMWGTGMTYASVKGLKYLSPRLYNWFKNYMVKGGSAKDAKVAQQLAKISKGHNPTTMTDLQKWEKKVREIEKGWAKNPTSSAKPYTNPARKSEVDKMMASYKESGLGVPFKDIEKFRRREALRKMNERMARDVPIDKSKYGTWTPRDVEKAERAMSEYYSRPALRRGIQKEYFPKRDPMSVHRPSEKSTGRIIGEGTGIVGIASLVNHLADERMRAAEERHLQQRGDTDPYPLPYKIDETRPNIESMVIDPMSIRPAPKLNPLEALLEEEGLFE